MSGVIEWAHQGGAKEAPSNTLGAMRRALQLGGNVGLELDVHRTNDGRLVVIHDRTLRRTTNGRGRVRRHNLRELQSLNAAWWWVKGKVDDHDAESYPLRHEPLDQDRRIPTLDEVLELRNRVNPKVPMTIEIKGWRAARPVVELLQREPPPVIDVSTITVTSFFDPILWLVRWHLLWSGTPRFDLAPGMTYMFMFWLLGAFGIHAFSSRYARLQIPIRKVVTFATPRLIESAHKVRVRGKARASNGKRRRLAVDVWTIDDSETMADLIDLGVDGIMTDCPALLRKVVRMDIRLRRHRQGTASLQP